MSKIFVIAGNRAEAESWTKQHLDKRWNLGETTLSMSEYVIVNHPISLRGVKDPHGYFIGTWIERIDLEEIFQQLLVSVNDPRSRATINRLWEEWKDKFIFPWKDKMKSKIA